MDWITALIITSFLAFDKSFSFQPCILTQIHSFTLVNQAFFSLPINEGSPKYFSVLNSQYIKNNLVSFLSLFISILAKE